MKISYKNAKAPSLMKSGVMLDDAILEYPSVQDLYDSVREHTHWSNIADSLGSMGDNWFGIPGIDEYNCEKVLHQYMTDGYGEDYQRVADYGEPHSPQLGRVEPSLAGGVVNVPLYLSGDPACMMAPITQDRPVDSLAITVPGSCIFHVSAEQMLLRAAAIASYVPVLLDHGISVYVYSYMASELQGCREHRNELQLSLVKVFSTDRAFDPAEVFLGCGSPVFNRFLGFSHTDALTAEFGYSPTKLFGNGYGMPFSIGGGSTNKESKHKKINDLRERVEMLLPTTHVVHMPDMGGDNFRDARWHYDYVKGHIEKYLDDYGMVW